MHGMDAPIACSLTGPELAERRRIILNAVRKSRVRTARLPAGYAYEFDAKMLEQVRNLVVLERQCCPFLAFNIIEGETAIRLEVTGSPEAVGVIEDFFGEVATE
jgi:hypothetical protein